MINFDCIAPSVSLTPLIINPASVGNEMYFEILTLKNVINKENLSLLGIHSYTKLQSNSKLIYCHSDILILVLSAQSQPDKDTTKI
jgi:hypothetical protein